MNQTLTKEIVHHVFSGFGTGNPNARSLQSPEFQLSKKLVFTTIDVGLRENDVWGCKFSYLSGEVNVVLGDCSQIGSVSPDEMCLIVGLKGSPFYALYLDELDDGGFMIATSLDGKAWVECSLFLQGTFLAAMEQIKEMQGVPERLIDFEEMFNSMVSFIQFRDGMLDDGEDDEG